VPGQDQLWLGDIRAKGTVRDLKEITKKKVKEKIRKKRSPVWFKKVWVRKACNYKLFLPSLLQKNVVRNPIKKINRELIKRPI
jgi:glutaredoxin